VAYSFQGKPTGQLDSASDWQMVAAWDKEIGNTLGCLFVLNQLIGSTTSQSSSEPAVLMRLDRLRPRPNSLKI
jgi:hypothetical protein